MKPRLYLTVFKRLYTLYSRWAAYVLLIIGAIYTALFIFIPETRTIDYALISNFQQVPGIFMLIVGIITGAGMLKFFIYHGVTRRHFFIGTLLSSVLLAVSWMLIGTVLTYGLYGLDAITPIDASREMAPLAGESRGMAVTFMSGASTTLLSFFVGWMIGFGFSRFGGYAGFGAIAAGIAVLGIRTEVWDSETTSVFNLPRFNEVFGTSLPLAFGGTLALIVLIGAALFLFIREAPVSVD